MSSTRYASVTANPDDAPERHLSSGRLRGISIGMNIVARVARVLPEAERSAMLWLTNYAHKRDITADALSEELDLDKAEIRRALTDPDADRARFVRQVAILRSKFETEIGKLYSSTVLRKVRNAVKFAMGDAPQIVEIIGKTRIGKTFCAKVEFLKRMDHAVWLHCPNPGAEREFLGELADALGVSSGNALKSHQVIQKINSCFGKNRLRLLFVDEGHRLWPADLRHQPKRIEFLRDLWEKLGVSVIILATPQYSESLAQAMEDNPRWAPGQWDGRVQRFHLSDTMSDEDLAGIARHHLPDGTEAMIDQLVLQAKSSEGFAGSMVKAIQRAKFMASMDNETLGLEHIKKAQAELAKGTRIETLAKRGNGRKRDTVLALRRTA